MPEIQPIPDHVKANFDVLLSAAAHGDLALLASADQATGEPRYILCAMNQDGENVYPMPVAVMAWDNPYELWADPT